MGFLSNFFGMNPTPTPVETVTPAATRKDDVLVTAPKKSSAFIASAAPITNELIGIYEKLRAEALESNDVATADAYQSLIDEERERLKEEAKAAARKKAEEEKRCREAAEAAAKKKAEDAKRLEEEAKAAARKKAEEEKRRRAEEAAKAELMAKAKAIGPLLEYFTQEEARANDLINAIADTKYGKEAILKYAATAKK